MMLDVRSWRDLKFTVYCLQLFSLLFFDLKVQSGRAERTVYRLGFVVDLNCEPVRKGEKD